jgi:hypothetical protein
MTHSIAIHSDHINTLDLSVVKQFIQPKVESGEILQAEQTLQFHIDYPLDPETPQEYPEIPEIRLWFIRLDSVYPWLPYLLDWRSGELVRYAAMLVPHEFSKKEGIHFNPQALDLFLMQKVFVIHDWLNQLGHPQTAKLKQMAEVFGYELADHLFELLSVELG